MAFKDGDLYISAVSRILVLRDIENHLDDPPIPQVVNDKFPTETHHGSKFIAFGPDGKLYVPIGAPCNICDPGPGHGKLTRMNPDGSGVEDVAHGIRNTVGFDWQPGTNHLWFTDNGRDMMGNDIPSDELNEITRPDEHFGYPYCQLWYEPLVSGFEQNDSVWGRSVDVQPLPDGSLLISDDLAGAVYG